MKEQKIDLHLFGIIALHSFGAVFVFLSVQVIGFAFDFLPEGHHVLEEEL